MYCVHLIMRAVNSFKGKSFCSTKGSPYNYAAITRLCSFQRITHSISSTFTPVETLPMLSLLCVN